jgi:hypothetical protein
MHIGSLFSEVASDLGTAKQSVSSFNASDTCVLVYETGETGRSDALVWRETRYYWYYLTLANYDAQP